jgi:membrane protease YdiL (CAAX protease family)
MKEINNETFERRVLKEIGSSVVVLDSKGMIQYINAPASILFEMSNDIAPGEVHFTTGINNAYNDKFCEYILNAIYKKDKSHRGTIKYLSPSGKKHVFRISASYLESQDYVIITIDDLTFESNLLERINNSTIIFSLFLFIMGAWVMFCALWYKKGKNIPEDILTIFVEILGVFIFLFILKFTHLSLKEMGILNENNKKAIKEGLIISGICTVVMFAIKIVGRMIDPNLFRPERPFFYFVPMVALSYVFTSLVQEFLARCVVQFNLERIIQGKYKEVVAIVLSGLLFSTLHVYYGFDFMFAAALLAMLEGIIYAKQQSLISIWIVHYVFGIVGMSLGLV